MAVIKFLKSFLKSFSLKKWKIFVKTFQDLLSSNTISFEFDLE